MKTTIKVSPSELLKMKLAAKCSGVRNEEADKVGGELYVEINFRSPDQLVLLGKHLVTVTDVEAKAYNDKMAKKAA